MSVIDLSEPIQCQRCTTYTRIRIRNTGIRQMQFQRSLVTEVGYCKRRCDWRKLCAMLERRCWLSLGKALRCPILFHTTVSLFQHLSRPVGRGIIAPLPDSVLPFHCRIDVVSLTCCVHNAVGFLSPPPQYCSDSVLFTLFLHNHCVNLSTVSGRGRLHVNIPILRGSPVVPGGMHGLSGSSVSGWYWTLTDVTPRSDKIYIWEE